MTLHPRFSCSQHHAFFWSDQRSCQFEYTYPDMQSKSRCVVEVMVMVMVMVVVTEVVEVMVVVVVTEHPLLVCSQQKACWSLDQNSSHFSRLRLQSYFALVLVVLVEVVRVDVVEVAVTMSGQPPMSLSQHHFLLTHGQFSFPSPGPELQLNGSRMVWHPLSWCLQHHAFLPRDQPFSQLS